MLVNLRSGRQHFFMVLRHGARTTVSAFFLAKKTTLHAPTASILPAQTLIKFWSSARWHRGYGEGISIRNILHHLSQHWPTIFSRRMVPIQGMDHSFASHAFSTSQSIYPSPTSSKETDTKLYVSLLLLCRTEKKN